MGKNKNGRDIGPNSKGHARSMKKVKGSKIKKMFLSSLQVKFHLQITIWTSRLRIRASQSYPCYMKSKKIISR